MKANVPEKIYIKDFGDKLSFGYYTKQFDGFDIEYTRTDAFIEKAFKWLEENVEKHISADGEYTVYYEEMFEDFKKYIKGE